jgi:soluble lytic murein transglycosylase-like protein
VRRLCPLGTLLGRAVARAAVVTAAVCLSACATAAAPATADASAQDLMQDGWQAYQAGALGHAQQAFLSAARAAPGWAAPAVWLGAVLVARGERSDAAGWFRAALTRNPTMAEAGYATEWLARLGVAVERPRWQIGTLDGFAAFVRSANPSLSLAQARWVGAALRAASVREQVDVKLLAAVVYVESRFEHRSVSSAGAEGLGQLMPVTAAGLGVDPRDPWENVVGAARLLHEDVTEFGSVPLGLAAYNAGSGAVRRWGGIPPYAETQWYVWAVLWIRDGLA